MVSIKNLSWYSTTKETLGFTKEKSVFLTYHENFFMDIIYYDLFWKSCYEVRCDQL